MKVDSITNTNFRGLFTDRTKENGGNWRMEYRPYSWETNKAKKAHVDVYSSKLPTNEEIYIEEPNLKISQDILGTKSYIRDTRYGRDILRINIDDMPALSLGDSLKVKEKKLVAFLQMKKEAMDALKEPLKARMDSMFDIAQRHNAYASDINRDMFSHQYTKDGRAQGIKNNFDKMTKIAEENGKDFQKYIRLTESAANVRKDLETIRAELAEIYAAEVTNTLIDLSKQNVSARDEQIQRVLQNLEKAKDKVFALPNRIVSVEEIVKVVGKDFSIQKAMDYIHSLMPRKHMLHI